MSALRRVVIPVVLLVSATMLTAPGAAAEAECTITGTEGDDFLKGDPFDNVICGLGGNDNIKGGGGNDVLIGGDGADHMNGGQGNDTLLGEAGPDRLNTLDRVSGNDVIEGGADTNRCKVDPGDSVVDCTIG